MKNVKLTTIGIWAQVLTLLFIAFGLGCASSVPTADQAKAIDESINATLTRFNEELQGADKLVQSAKGVLVFPGIVQGSVVAGAEYGEGALRIGGRTVDYYSIAAASFGLQLGAQKKDIIILFMDQNALDNFQKRRDWKAGVDGTITLVTLGTGASVDTIKLNQSILGFVFGQTGLLGGISLQGSRITKLQSVDSSNVVGRAQDVHDGRLN